MKVKLDVSPDGLVSGTVVTESKDVYDFQRVSSFDWKFRLKNSLPPKQSDWFHIRNSDSNVLKLLEDQYEAALARLVLE